jgi:hypothetical protein
MNTRALLVTIFILAFIVIKISIGTPAFSKSAIGTIETHKFIWKNHIDAVEKKEKLKSDRDARLDKYNSTRNSIIRERDDVQEKINSLKNDIGQSPTIIRGEFEKTFDFEQRCRRALDERNTSMHARLLSLQKSLVEITARLDKLTPPTELNEPDLESTTIELRSTKFMIPALMGSYNADTEKVTNFVARSIVCLPNDESKNLPRTFKLEGNLSGISLPPAIAEKARRLSNEGRLWVYFDATPLAFKFTNGFFEPRTEQEMASELARVKSKKAAEIVGKGLLAVGAGLLVNAVGGDPGVFSLNLDSSSFSSGNEHVAKEKYVKAWVIETGWNGSPAPVALFSVDSKSASPEVVWRANW